MIKYIKNNYIIASATMLYCIFIGVICSINYSLTAIAINTGLFMLTMALNVLVNGIFLFAIDAFIRQKKTFKLRFFEITKALWISQLILLPISLIAVILNPFISLSDEATVKIITFSLKYICPFVLFFSYKNITKSDWPTTIKVVSITFILMVGITQLLHFV